MAAPYTAFRNNLSCARARSVVTDAMCKSGATLLTLFYSVVTVHSFYPRSVVTDAMCKPFSMGRNLFCVHSKKRMDDEPELKVR